MSPQTIDAGHKLLIEHIPGIERCTEGSRVCRRQTQRRADLLPMCVDSDGPPLGCNPGVLVVDGPGQCPGHQAELALPGSTGSLVLSPGKYAAVVKDNALDRQRLCAICHLTSSLLRSAPSLGSPAVP